ncbi:MAG: hypothetical protein ACSHX7_09010 [Luteolibacter sp.]
MARVSRMKLFGSALVLLGCVSCSSLPVPEPTGGDGSSDAKVILRNAAKAEGDLWRSYRKVEVGYDGEWSGLAKRVQPVLTDPEFRKSSEEVYEPRAGRITQVHSGVAGTKRVVRKGDGIEISYNGEKDEDTEKNAAAALVADAYELFLYRSSLLVEKGSGFVLSGERELDGRICYLVSGNLEGGIGDSPGDSFIAWIGKESGVMERFQFSLNGLESTVGADVDVTFLEKWKAKDGSVWPGRFLEHIQRPIHAKAHEWRMTSLVVDGRKMR